MLITTSQNHSVHNRTSRGNVLVEYTLIGGAVVVVAITGLMLLSSSVDRTMAMIRDDMKNHREAAITSLVARQGGTSAIAAQLTADQRAALEADLATKLETTGANGSTVILSNQIRSLAESLLAEGKISEEQYDVLLRLSNQGHKIAQVQGMIEDAMRLANGNYEALEKMRFAFDGQTYTAKQLSALIGFNGPTPEYFANNSILNKLDSTQAEMAAFLDLYNEAMTSGALNDPEVLATVTSASTQVASMGEATEHTLYLFKTEQADMTSPDALKAVSSELATHMDSSKICKAGKFKDNGKLCSP